MVAAGCWATLYPDRPRQHAPVLGGYPRNMSGALPTLVVIGAMKCGTSALHRYLAAHPQVQMSEPKELNFFFGPEPGTNSAWSQAESWDIGHWHRGPAWYARHFDSSMAVRGESSPGYTSPDHFEVAARMASVVPDVRLLCLVRDPLERALSQFAHHRREGAERLPVAQALLDPDSQYVTRSRYADRLEPFLEHFPATALLVVVQERLLTDRRGQMRAVLGHVGADPDWDSDALDSRVHVGDSAPAVSDEVRAEFEERVADDVSRVCDLVGDDLPEWSC